MDYAKWVCELGVGVGMGVVQSGQEYANKQM